ncbi:leucyl aminopeptidase [Spiractinospora alimapuensis]|uniref:leucyl aminopeptidase n=1 Tax=Spiractinospora alimapuensis TaxID=2820884 RepID=UPI001EEB8C54|nr:leucyl aminopeptidase [Spiractinospora alimapuensis]QVQ54051.1 leucyl aminopeptidase [Spiractinospora alimapuensis]
MPLVTNVEVVSDALTQSVAPLVAVAVRAGENAPDPDLGILGLTTAEMDARLPAPLLEVLRMYDVTGKPGEIRDLPVDLGAGPRRLVLFGVGAAQPEQLRRAAATLVRRTKGTDHVAVALPDGASDAGTVAFVEGLQLGSYAFSWPPVAGTADFAAEDAATRTVTLHHADVAAVTSAVAEGTALARGAAIARDLANVPSNEKGPAWMVERAREVAERDGLSCQVWDADELKRDGFGAILGVGDGSPRPPRLVRLDYAPAEADRHVVLVGKGITFDTGGLSLKPNDNMKLMKTDMSGAAIVLAVMSRLAGLGAATRVTALLPLAENSFSGSAQRPSDVMRTYDGQTVEILNTDAEGRLVLADAIGYAVRNLAPDVLVDVATLTGAAKLALGTTLGALYANDDELARELEEAGGDAGEPMWRMPLEEQYVDSLDSTVADMANIGTNPDYGRPGATEAALFLRKFVGDTPWAHLDIAGPGRAMGENGILSKGATGFSTRLLLRWLTTPARTT